ncbi:MAG: Fe(3+) ABC transporter substrate-binding protein [Acidimicrobiaceae bacterium]|nr:Fe(3+) ABC transporter substrate-binding protein [Acidimicrobiaceae bacterium]
MSAVSILSVPTACGGDGDTIRVYTGRHYDLEEAFQLFSSETGVSIEFLQGSDAELRERIAAEGEDTQADIYMTVDAGNLARAAEQGVFIEVESDVLNEAVPESLRDPDGQWYALSRRARTIVYSSERVSLAEAPSTYEELAGPEWKGRLCLRNSSNTYTQSLVASLIGNVGYGEALRIVSGWADNAEILSNDVIALNSVRDGLCDVAIVNHYYLARLMEDDPDFPVSLVWADQEGRGTHVNISGAGITKYADDPELALQLLEWLATDGQNTFVDGNHEYPVNPAVAPEDLIADEFGSTFVADDLNAAEFGALNADAVRLLDEAGYE